jgi:hypothetical protein
MLLDIRGSFVFAMVFHIVFIDLLDGVRLVSYFTGKRGERTLFFGWRTLKVKAVTCQRAILHHKVNFASHTQARWCSNDLFSVMGAGVW